MTAYICLACGVQFPETFQEPSRCPICEDSRAFGRERGDRQRWTTPSRLRLTHRNRIIELEPGITSITTDPIVSVGNHCILVQGQSGNVLWDCISLIDDETVEAITELGGVSAIAISHPHFYGSMVEWSRAFGDVPVYIHRADEEWVVRPDRVVKLWDGDSLSIDDEFTLIHCGGHFPGATVLHVSGQGNKPSRLFTGDVIALPGTGGTITFMHNYPKQIPLPAEAIEGIVEAIEPFEFDRIYGCWTDRVISEGGKELVLRSAQDYIERIAT